MPKHYRNAEPFVFVVSYCRASMHILPCPDQGKADALVSSSSISICSRLRTETRLVNVQRQLEEELDDLDQHGRLLSREQYLSLLRACNQCRSLALARRLHFLFANRRLDTTSFLGENLLVTLAKCGALDNALNVFQSLPYRTTFGWTALLSGLTDWGRPQSALAMYQDMVDDGAVPDSYTFVSLFKACGTIQNLETGQKLHMDAQQMGLTNEILLTNTLISMYNKCQATGKAEVVFSESTNRDVVTWNVMMAGYVEEAQSEKALCLYRQMCNESISLRDEHTFALAFQALRTFAEDEEALSTNSSKEIAFEIGRALHAEVHVHQLSSRPLIGNTLISMYGSCGMMAHAVNAFHGLIEPDIVSKTAMLSAFVEQDQAGEALHLYCKISQEEIASNHQTFLSALKACGSLAEKEEACTQGEGEIIPKKWLEIGQAIHEDTRACGADDILSVANSILSMYRKCGSVSEAEVLFQRLNHLDVISWNTMLCAYVEDGNAVRALGLYRQMCEEGFVPNRETFLGVLQACDELAIFSGHDLKGYNKETCATHSCPPEVGIALHADVKKKGLASDIFLGTTLIGMYGKYGWLAGAESVFCSLCTADLISCTAMLAVFIEQGEEERALSLYTKMQQEGMLLDNMTIAYILQASWKTGRLDIVRYYEFVIVSSIMDSNSFLEGVPLMQAYGASANTKDAKAVFDRFKYPDLAAWNVCITAHTSDISQMAGIHIFEQMQVECFCPDASTFTSIIASCTYTGLVESGILYLQSINENFSFCKDVNHYVLVVDLVGRAGDLDRATDFVKRVPKQVELPSWLCLLSACRLHGNTELGQLAFDCVVGLQTKDPSAYVLMSNMRVDMAI